MAEKAINTNKRCKIAADKESNFVVSKTIDIDKIQNDIANKKPNIRVYKAVDANKHQTIWQTKLGNLIKVG